MQRRANSFTTKRNIVLSAFIFVGLFSLLYTPARLWFTQVVFSAGSAPLVLGNTASGAGNSIFSSFRYKQSLVYENAVLRAENNRMQAQVLDRNLLQERVMKLEEVLGRSRNDNRVVADVVVGIGRSLYDTVILDVGSDHGVQNGDTVVYAGSAMVGQIVEVSATSAKMKFFSSPGEEYSALLGPHSIPATVHGKGNGNFDAKIPENSDLVVGDKVIVPKGNLLLGTISEIEKTQGVPFATVYFRSPFNVTEIRTVEVLVNTHSL